MPSWRSVSNSTLVATPYLVKMKYLRAKITKLFGRKKTNVEEMELAIMMKVKIRFKKEEEAI